MTIRMRPRKITRILAMLLALWGLAFCGCSDDDGKSDPDGAVAGDAAVADGAQDLQVAVDLPQPDQDTSKQPVIDQIIPNNGFADGGSAGRTPVVITGQNFAAGTIVFIDGSNQIMNVKVNSPVSLSFDMPKNPYGAPDYDKPITVSVAVFVNGMMSNVVDFHYTVSQPMDETFKGSVLTSSMDAYSDFASEPMDGRVFLQGVTDAQSGAAADIKAMIGIGAVGSDPSKDPGWKWTDATFKQDDGTYDVYTGTIKAPLSQTYDVAFRFSNVGDIAGQGRWIYADTDESDLVYDPAKAAKLNATNAPVDYCKSSADCMLSAWAVVCKVDDADPLNNHCVECLEQADCSDNPKALGPKCMTDENICYCEEDPDCPENPNGAVCVQGYCGCQSHDNCPHPAQCTEDPETQMTTCK